MVFLDKCWWNTCNSRKSSVVQRGLNLTNSYTRIYRIRNYFRNTTRLYLSDLIGPTCVLSTLHSGGKKTHHMHTQINTDRQICPYIHIHVSSDSVSVSLDAFHRSVQKSETELFFPKCCKHLEVWLFSFLTEL